MDLDVDKLINLVQDRPQLYNSTLKDYHNKDIHEKLWEDIGKEMKVPAYACKLKWKNLRSSYSRAVKTANLAESGASKRKKWYLLEAMSFLNDHMGQQRNKAGNKSNEDEYYSEDETLEEYNENVNKHNYGTFSNNNNTPEETQKLYNSRDDEIALINDLLDDNMSATKSKKTLSKTNSSAFIDLAESMTEFLKAKMQPSREDASPLLHFFKGILPEAEQLCPKMQCRFKTSVIQLLNNLLDEQDQEEIASQPPSSHMELIYDQS